MASVMQNHPRSQAQLGNAPIEALLRVLERTARRNPRAQLFEAELQDERSQAELGNEER